MQLTPKQSNTLNMVLMIAGALAAILGPVVEYLLSGQLINSAGVLTALGAGIALYAKRAPGHLTGDQAEAKAREHAENVLAKASLPPPKRETMASPLDVHESLE